MGTGKVHRKYINIPKIATNVDDFQNDVSCRTAFKVSSLLSKSNTVLKEKAIGNGSVHISFPYQSPNTAAATYMCGATTQLYHGNSLLVFAIGHEMELGTYLSTMFSVSLSVT
jgi:hypothetical protein